MSEERPQPAAAAAAGAPAPEQHAAASHGGGGHKGGGHGGGHGGGEHEEHEGVPEWVVSFADNALLQMGFFVILFAMNVGPKATQAGGNDAKETGPSANQLDAAIAIREAFHGRPLDASNPDEIPLIRRKIERESGASTDNGPDGRSPTQQAIRPTDYSNTTGSVAFDQNQTAVTSAARPLLAQAAQRLRGQRWIVEVRGHCSSAEAQGDSGKGMSLSYARALAVAAVLVENGMTWNQLRLVAAADNERIRARAYDDEAHRSNQRVEIIVTGDAMAPDPFAGETGP